MRIPIDAIIPPAKLTKYLLVPLAESDKSDYLARAGFDQSNVPLLEAAIRKLSATVDAVRDRVNQFGTYYVVRGMLQGPIAVLPVRSVWIQGTEGVISFVTLVPDEDD